MGFNDEYMKLRKKRLGEAEKEADSKTTNKTFTDTYNELRNERLGESNKAPVFTNKTRTSYSSGPIFGEDEKDNIKNWRDEKLKLEREQAEKEREEKRRSWFTTPDAFKDGYQFGDVAKTLVATGGDSGHAFLAGIIGMGEDIVDTAAYIVGGVGGLFGADEFQKDTEEFIEKELYDAEKVADAVGSVTGWQNKLLNELLNGGDKESNSIFGEKSEGLIQSGGRLAATVGLQAVGVPWFLTTGVTSFGDSVEGALNDGASYGVAGLSAGISAGAEILTEKLSGGISFGGKTLDDVLLDPLTKNISNKLVRSLVNVGLDAAGEGAEEVISSVASRLGTALYKEESIGELLTSEEAFDEYLESFIGGAVLGGGMGGVNAVSSSVQGRDYKTGLTDNEQTVLDKEIAERIAEAEADGTKLTSKERAKIEEQAKRDLQKGLISTDKIEDILGKDTYKAYQDAVANEDAIAKEYAELGSKEYLDPAEYERYVELGELIKDKQSDKLKAEADKNYAELLKQDTYLQNSYAERTRRGQTFDADLTQYTDENARKTVENAIKYGMNNGTDAHDFVDFAAKIAAKKGFVVDFTNTAKLKESIENGNEYGIGADAENVQAFVSDSKKTIVINMQAKKSLNSLVGHEVTHTLETSDAYGKLQKYIFDYARAKNEYASRYKDIEGRYSKVDADIQKELTADLCGDYLLTDYDFISQLATKDRNVFQKVYDEIKYMFKLATTGSREARALEKAKHYYEKALREATKAESKSGNKYSLSDSDGKKLTAEQSEYFKDSKMRDENGNLKVMYHGSQDAGFHVFDSRSKGASTVAIAFNSEQIKSVVNAQPTSDPDIRFSLSKSVEETKDLMALHNLESGELLKSLDLGGLPMPSIAVIKAEAGHEQYGDVSLIIPKDAIDPKKNKANKVYGGDAWTPTYPRIEYKPRASVEKKISDKYYDLARKFGYDAVRPLYRYVNELEDVLNRSGGETGMLNEIYNDTGIMQVYLADSGKGKVETVQKEIRTELSDAEVEMNEYFINALGGDVVDAVMARSGESPMAHRTEYWKEHGETIKEAYKKFLAEEYGFTDEEVQNVLSSMKTYDYLKIVRDAHLYRKNGRVTTRTEADISATNDAIKAAASDGYKEWVDGLFKGIEEKTGIRNNAGYFTNSGNRRSWDALHWENTLENVVRVMKQQNQTGADAIFGASQLFAVSAKDYRSIADVKADSDRLYKMSEDEYEAVKESYMQRMQDISQRIMDKGERNQFIALDNAMECIVDAVRSSKTAAGIYRELKQYSQLTVTEQDAADIAKLVNDIANMPTGYFEAKPQRAVGFDEVGVFVIPRNADAALKQELLNRGYSIAEYDPDVEGDRQRVVNSFEEYKFSLARGTEKTYGNYNVYGRDLELAPMAEDIAPMPKDAKKDWRDIVSTVREPETDASGDWTQEYADYHKGVMEQLTFDAMGEVVADVDNGLTSDELKAKSDAAKREYDQFMSTKKQGEGFTEKEMLTLQALYSRYSFYDSVAEDRTYADKLRYSLSKDAEQAETADARERLDSLTDENMPPEFEAPYAPDPEKETITVDSDAAASIAQKVGKIIELDKADSARMADIIREYAKGESFTESDLHDAIRENFHYTEEMENDADEISQAKQHMRGARLYIDEIYKEDFDGKRKDGFNAFRQDHFGHFYLTTNPSARAMSVDSFYEELTEYYPDLFPADIGNAADRLLRMGEVADMQPTIETRTSEYDSDTIDEVVELIESEVSQYSQKQTMRLLDEAQSAFYKSVDAKDIAPTAEYLDENGQVNLFAKEAEDPAEKEILNINNRLEQERARLRTELQQKKARAQAIVDNKDAFVSNKASELYEELRNLKKGVRASKDLGYLLDYGYEWSSIKAALVNIKHTPDRLVNQSSPIESIAREMINSHYEDAAYRLDELDAEYQKKVAKLESEAETQRQRARATAEESESKPRTRKDLHQEKIDGIIARFAERGIDFDKVLKNAKNLATWRTVDNTPQRVMEKALGYEEGQILADLTVNKVATNESEGVKWLNSITDKRNGLLAELTEQYHIKPGSKESAAAQMFAEGLYVNDKGEYIKYGIEELTKDFPDANVRANIIGLAGDQRIRQFYDDTLNAINEARARNLYAEIPRLENYFLHFRAMEDTFSQMGLPFNPNDIKAKDLPTDLNGVTADLKPGKPFFASEMCRRGYKTTYDLLGGLERYATSAKNQIYHIDDIQTLRALRNYIADTYGQANGLAGLDELSEIEAEQRIKEVYNAHLSTFAKFLNEEANILAGKTALIDRGLEGIIGRRGITFIDSVNKQVGANMVGYNVSSSLTNFISGVQAIAKTNKASCVKAFAQTAAGKFNSLFGNGNAFAENDPFLIRRKGAERFHRTPFQKIGDAGYFLASAVDNVTSEFVVRAKYNEYIKNGMSEQQAIEAADKWAARLLGDRSLGQMPHLYNSKMLGLVTKFQLEVRNQLDSQFYDTVQEAKMSNKDIESEFVRNAKTAAKVTATLFELAVLQHAFGKAFESVAGYNPAFDIISVLATAFGFDDDEESEDTALDNVEQGFLELLEDLPYTSTLTGGRIPISSALPLKELVTGKDEYGNEKSRLKTLGEIAPYYVLPGGYGQIKKTAQGLSMFDDDLLIAGSYTDSGNLRFPVDDTIGNRVQAGVFGQWASDNARNYFDNERAPLNPKQTQEFIDSEMSIDDYWKYREGLSARKTLAEKADYIFGLDVPTEIKNLLINNIADRKEPIDMSTYGEYGSFEEFDYAMKNPEKYEFLTGNGISYNEYMGAGEEEKDAYDWGYKHPEEYEMWDKLYGDVTYARRYAKELYDIHADKDEEGNSIRGSRKEKVIDYVSNLDVEYGVKCILFKSEYPADDTYNADILDYLNRREDLSFDDIKAILTELGFTVYDNGTVEW